MFLDVVVFWCFEVKINNFYYRCGVNGFKIMKNIVMCFLVFIYDMIKKNVVKKNWMEIYKDIKKLFEFWKCSKLIVFCKFCIIKY